MKQKIKGGILAAVGYILSPLSWWNDIIINIPLAYIFALPFSFISKNLFLPMMIIGYWGTNIIGLMLMHNGIESLIKKDRVEFSKNKLTKDIIISLVYTLVVAVFIKIGWLKMPLEYFQ